jgi:hypothetical protein
MINLILHSLQPSRGAVNFILAQLYIGVNSCAASRNSTNYIALLADIEADNATGDLFIITDNLSSHNSTQTRAWLAEHPRLHQVFIPTGAGSAQPARGLVASLPSRCPGGSEFRQP